MDVPREFALKMLSQLSLIISTATSIILNLEEVEKIRHKQANLVELKENIPIYSLISMILMSSLISL